MFMSELNEISDPREELRRHISEFLDPVYIKKTEELHARGDFLEALGICLSGEDEEGLSFSVETFIRLLKNVGVGEELTKKAEESNFDLHGKLESYMNDSPDEDIADEIFNFIKETLE